MYFLQHKIVFYFSLLCVIFSCQNESNISKTDSLQTKDSAFFVSRANGDTVYTGVPLALEGKWKDTSIYNTHSYHGNANYLTKESPSYSNVIDSINFVSRRIYIDSMEVRIPGTDTLLPLEQTICTPIIIPLNAGKSRKTEAMRHKENARIDLQYINTESGLPSSYINTILFTSKGIMWIGTQKGLCRYDGNVMTTYTSQDGLPDDYISRLFEDKQGNLWIGSQYGGIAKYDGHFLTILNDKNGLPSNNISGIEQDSKGNIWIGMWGGGISKFDGKKTETIARKQGLFESRVTHITIDTDDKIWIATNGGGLYTYDGTKVSLENQQSRIGEMYLTYLFFDSKDRFWTGAWNEIRYLKDDSVYAYRFNQEAFGIPTSTIFEDSKGNIWLTSFSNGVIKYDGVNFIILSEIMGLPTNKVNGICEDGDGNIWFATDGGGLCRYNPNSFNYYDVSTGLPSKAVNSITETADGRIIFATDDGVVFFNDTTFQSMCFRDTTNIQKGRVYDVMVDKDSSIWFTVLNDMVYHLIDDSVQIYGRWQGIHDHNITSMAQRSNGEIWFGSWNVGISRLKDEQFHVFNSATGFHNFIITDLIVDHKDNLWIASDGEGITKYDGINFTHITENEGLTNNHINAFYEDSFRTIWILGKRGIDMIVDGELKNFPGKYLLPDQDVVSMTQDKDGNYWVFTANGFLYLKLKGGRSTKEWNIDNYTPKIFTQFDGLIGMDFIPRSVFIDSKNRIWFGTGKGLMMKNLSSFDVAPVAPEISLETIELNGQFVDYHNLNDTKYDSISSNFSSIRDGAGAPQQFKNLPTSLTLTPDVNHLTFRFTAKGWHSDKIVYTYKLEGVDENWSQLGSNGWAEYRNLSYGDYIFQLKGIGESNVESQILEYNFTILPPWYHTWWARILFLTLIILGVRFLIRTRTKQLQLKQIILEKKVVERTAQLDIKNKELLSQNAIIEEQKLEVEKQHTLLEETHTEIKDSINYAKRIQEAILPTQELITELIPKNFIFYKPKDIVAGDFYWIEKTEDRILFSAADCTGHGVPGAMVSVVCYNALNRAVREFGVTSPEKILDKTRDIVLETFQQNNAQVNDGMDASLISLRKDKTTKTLILEFSGANNSVAIVRNNEMFELDGDKQPIGNYKDAKPFSLKSFTLQKGDIIYLFTDGYADQFGGPKGKKLKSKTLKEILVSISTLSLEEQKNHLNVYLEEWKGDLEQLDDISVFGFEI